MRYLLRISTAGLVAVLGGALTAAPALAEGATVINDQGCTLIDGNGAFTFTSSDHAVITPSGNGILKCRAQVTPPAGGEAVFWDFHNTSSVTCGTPAGTTEDWRQTVSASGQATLTCKFRQN